MRHASKGMTLIEVLVALTLLSLLSVGMISAFHIGHRAFDGVVRLDQAYEDVALVQRFVRDALESAYPFERGSGTKADAIGLDGTSDRLSVTASRGQQGVDSGLRRFVFSVNRQPDGSQSLEVTSQPDRNGGDDGGSREIRPETLIPHIEGVEWSYLDVGQGNVWLSQWTARRAPALVRLRVQFAAKDHRRWPDLIVAPRVTDDANCHFDVVAQACRESGS